jgi:ABC-type nickel/cobalt efflux system permease component RcnA
MHPRLLLIIVPALCYIIGWTSGAPAHDIPKQRVDRTIQLKFEPGAVHISYTLELDDTTIAADLKRLNPGPLSPDPDDWLDEYGKLVAPQLSEGLQIRGPSGVELMPWQISHTNRIREQHTIYRFQFTHILPEPGIYRIRDTNFGTSEGLSRLGVFASDGAILKSSLDYPEKAASHPYQPVWMLDNEALKRTREWSGEVTWTVSTTKKTPEDTAHPVPAPIDKPHEQTLIWASFLLGFWHTIQPGHGKSWMIAAAARRPTGLVGYLAMITGWIASHFAVILILACVAWIMSPEFLTPFSVGLKQLAGLLIAGPAAFRLGQAFRACRSPETSPPKAPDISTNAKGLSIGLTAGLVPCWEAVGLLLLGFSAGHPWTGLALVGGFIAGGVLVMILMIVFAGFFGAKLSRTGFVGYVCMTALDFAVLWAGLLLLLF